MAEKKPTAAEIHSWVATTYPTVAKPAVWGEYLEGLPWGYVKPVCQIAVNAYHQHPALVLSTAGKASADAVFKLTARNHIAAKGAPAAA